MELEANLRAIADMTIAMSKATTAEEIFAEARLAIERVTDTRRTSVLLFDPDGVMRFKAWGGISDAYRRAVEGHTPWTVGQRDAVAIAVPDVTTEPSLAAYLPIIRAEGIASMLMIPLVTGGGTIGKFMLYFSSPRTPTPTETSLVQNIAAHTAFAVDRLRAFDALTTSEERHRSILEQLHTVVFQLNASGVFEFVSAPFHELLGHDGTAGRGLRLVDLVDEADRGAVDDFLARLFAEGNAGSHHVECRVRHTDGPPRWLDLTARVTHDAQGGVGAIGTMTDISERRATREALAAAQERLAESQRLESLGVFAGGIAHDFNNLLVGVLLNASQLLVKLDPTSPLRTAAHDIEVAGQRAAELTRQLLAYSGKSKLVVRRIQLPSVLAETERLVAAALSKKAVVRRHVAPRVPPIDGDATQLQQVAMNLLINASDALGGETGTIEVSVSTLWADRALLARAVEGADLPAGEYVALEVKDTGVGMDEATRARIFDPFFTTKFHGRGLGLAVVLGIVRGHRGAIIIDSKPGEGTRVRVLLPAATRDDDTASPESVVPASRVLVVDDEAMVRVATGRSLEDAGFSVSMAESGRDALHWLATSGSDIDVVLLDLTMPEMSGLETLAILRERWPDLPVILMSGYTTAASQLDGLSRTQFLQKPFTFDHLVESVSGALGPRREKAGADERPSAWLSSPR